MKGNNSVKFFSIIIIIGILTYIAWFGELFGIDIPGVRDIKLGIDVQGGVQAQLTGKHDDGGPPTTKELETAKRIISIRLDNQGITDKNVTVDTKKGRIWVEIPWKPGEKNFDPQATINETIKTALLKFIEVDDNKKDDKGNYIPIGNPIIQGLDVVDAGVQTNSATGQVDVTLKLSKDAAKKFEDATKRLLNKKIAIYMDDRFIVAPTVEAVISDGEAIIQGQRSAKEAGELAAVIRSGSLPFKLEAIEVNSISPMLGQNALRVIVTAGFVSLLLVWLFMLAYYRLPGILADVALLAHTVIQLLMISWLGVMNLTLPGIAGVILTVGMGVDANIIIFERIKEELRNGKTLRAAIDVGFKRAFTAILDANMTTLISAVVLWIFGSGPIKGFAYTLGLGVILSFLTAVFVSRILLKSVADVEIAKNHKLYGV